MLYMDSGVYFFKIFVEVAAFGGASVLKVVDGFVEASLFSLSACFADFYDIVKLQQGGNQPFDGLVVGVVLQCNGFHDCDFFCFFRRKGKHFFWMGEWVVGGFFVGGVFFEF